MNASSRNCEVVRFQLVGRFPPLRLSSPGISRVPAERGESAVRAQPVVEQKRQGHTRRHLDERVADKPSLKSLLAWPHPDVISRLLCQRGDVREAKGERDSSAALDE